MRQREQLRLDREEEDMRRLLQAMAIKQSREDEEVARQFAEREKKLWADIDAAIKEVERQEAQLRQAAQETTRRLQAEEAERAAKAEQEARQRKADEDKRAKAKADEDERRKEEDERQRAQRVRDDQEKASAEQRKVEEARKADEKNKMANEWGDWVEKQRWMKREVIEPMKQDRATLMPMKKIMRLIGRSVGQVVNTKEGILRVVS